MLSRLWYNDAYTLLVGDAQSTPDPKRVRTEVGMKRTSIGRRLLFGINFIAIVSILGVG
jgi:hypothetical protein